MKLVSKEWLNRAKDDLDVIAEIAEWKHLTNMVAFHSQQAVEKVYKSIIEEFEIEFVKTHKLEILNEAVKNVIKFDVNLDMVKMLDEIYISSRYPTDLGLLPYGKPSSDDAKLSICHHTSIYS
jgi:HEPN domain-containing protein